MIGYRSLLLGFVLTVNVTCTAFTAHRRSPWRQFQVFTPNHAGKQPREPDTTSVSKGQFLPRPFRFEKFVDRLFDDADTNRDGTVDLTEAYEMVLRMYIKLNQKAPIPPPSRAKVYKIFRTSDVNHDDRINREEFTSLAKTLSRRAMVRLVAHKAVTLIAAPLLATEIVQILRQQPFIQRRLRKYAAYLIPDHLESELMTASFARTALIIVFVATLGNIAVGIVNFILDLSIRDDDDDG